MRLYTLIAFIMKENIFLKRMKSYLSLAKTLSAMIAFGVTAFSQVSAQPHPGRGYQLVFEENFDGDSVNTDIWHFRLDHRVGGNYIDGWNLKENVRVENGLLYIDCRHEMHNGKMTYTGGGVITNKNFGYGYYECKSKPFMAGKGVHTSFWQRGSSYPCGDVFEIDSHEVDSKTYEGANNLYIDLGNDKYEYMPWPHRVCVPFTTDHDGWWIDAYEYTPDGVTFYDNGIVVGRCDWPELNAAQQVWLTALNGCGRVDSDKLPGYSAFDYFRFYAKDYPGINILNNGNFEFQTKRANPHIPIGWGVVDNVKSIRVAKGAAAKDSHKVRIENIGAYEAKLYQELSYILDGKYTLSAMVRSSGKHRKAVFSALSGGKKVAKNITASAVWTKIEMPVEVSGNTVTVAFDIAGDSQQWLELDNVTFMKPAAQANPVEERPFTLFEDVAWSIAMNHPMIFKGDAKFCFFDRNVGMGEAITIDFTVNADKQENMIPIARMPKKGNSGWAVCLAADGGLVFQIGSIEEHTGVYAPAVYKAGKDCTIRCVYDHGTVYIYVDGKLLAKQEGIKYQVKDKTAPGRLGKVDYRFTAQDGVVVATNETVNLHKHKMFSGKLSKVQIYNEAIF